MPAQGLGCVFVVEASVPSDYLLADAVYHAAAEGAKWIVPARVAGHAYLIWDQAPSYIEVSKELSPDRCPPVEELRKRYQAPVIRASTLYQPNSGLVFAKGNGKADGLLLANPTPIHTLHLLANSVGHKDSIQAPRWPISLPSTRRILVHAGREVAVPGNVQPCDTLLQVTWPGGTATIGHPSDLLLPGTLDWRTENERDLRAMIRSARTFVGVPSLLVYHAAACGLRVLNLFPQDPTMVLWQSRGVNLWGQTDMIGDEPGRIEAWLEGFCDEILPGIASIEASPVRPYLYPKAGENPRYHPRGGLI